MKTNIDWIYYFDSISEYSDYLRSTTLQPAFVGQSSHSTYDPEWRGTETYEQADELLLCGDKEAASRIKEAQRALNVNVSSYIVQNKVKADYVGFAPHVPNFVGNVPKTMFNKKKIRKPQPVITIVYNSGATCGYDACEIAQAGATLLEAVRAIEASGIRVNLYTAQVSSSRGQYAGPIVRIKDADQYMDVLKCAYPLSSPSMLRRHKFAFLEQTEGVPSHFANGYGRSIKGGDILRKVELKGKKFDAVLTFYDVHQSSVDDVVNQIRQQTQNAKIQ